MPPFQEFDSVAAIATLSLSVNALQQMAQNTQMAIQQIGMGLNQLMEAHNALAKKYENLLEQVKSLTCAVSESTLEGKSVENGSVC